MLAEQLRALFFGARHDSGIGIYREPVLRHFIWDYTDFMVFSMWACIYGMHVRDEDQTSFYLICCVCLMPATVILYVGAMDIFLKDSACFVKFTFILYILLLPWAGILTVMFDRRWDRLDEGFFHKIGIHLCQEVQIMAVFVLNWLVGLLGLVPALRSSLREKSTRGSRDVGEGSDAAVNPLLPAPNASAGAARIGEPMTPALAKHLLNELLYDCFALSIQIWLLTEVRMKEKSFPYKVFVDFLNLMTTFIDLFMVKGPSFFHHILKTGGSPEKVLELMLHTAEELEQQAQRPEGDENTEGQRRPQETEHPPHAGASQSANAGGVMES